MPTKGHLEAAGGAGLHRILPRLEAEVKHMNEKGIQYKVFALGTGFTGTGFTGDTLERAASDGPIAL